jgi:hypothetical protein
MKQSDAAKVLGITGDITPEIVKQAYRRACSKYHPDRNPAGEEMMKAVNLAYETLKDHTGNIDSGCATPDEYADEMNRILNELLKLVGINIEVCGAWVWVTGNTRPYKDVLGKQGLGLFWASKKQAWYFRPSDWKSHSRGNWELDQIREKHGSVTIRGTPTYRNVLTA